MFLHSFGYRRVNIKGETLREMYVGALEDSKYDSAELHGVHALDEKASVALNPRYSWRQQLGCCHVFLWVWSCVDGGGHSSFIRSPRLKAILRDVKLLEESLPVHPDSAIFVRQVCHCITNHLSITLHRIS